MWTSEQEELRELAYKSAQKILGPVIAKDEEDAVFRVDAIREFGKNGLTGIPISSDLGGAGLGYVEYAMALEEIARVSVSYAISIAVSGLPQVILSLFGNNEQKEKYIPKLASGEHIGAFSLSESHSGSDAASLKTKAVKKGDKYILNGTKLWTTQGNVADTMIVFARTGEDGPKGISAFLVEKGTKGFRASKTEHKMGLSASPTCEMVLENVEVSEKNRIGTEGIGFKIAMTALDSGRVTIASIANGVARAAFEYCRDFSKERKQFGNAIAEFQGIQFLLADMYTRYQAGRLMVYQAAHLKDSSKPFTMEASAAKLFCTDAAMQTTTDAVQILGGVGYTKEYPVERYMREAKVLQIVEGTNQIQRIVLGKGVVK